MTIRVAVLGARGRMGSAVCQAVNQAVDMDLVARLDARDPINSVSLADAHVAVDFTIPEASEANVHALLDAGLDVVVGTTGWDEESYARVAEHLARPECAQRSVLIAPNFALSAVLAMSLAAKVAPYFESAEIIELHHPDKIDAPSGTALATARAIARSRSEAGSVPMPDATMSDPEGARGAVIDGVHVHAVRLRGLTAHEEIVFGNPGEQLTVRTDSFDRVSFMPGVLLGIRQIVERQGLTIGLDQLLDL